MSVVEWTGARGFLIFLSGVGPRSGGGNVEETGVEPAHMPGDFERSPGISLPSGSTALRGNLQSFCPVKLLTGSCRVTPMGHNTDWL